MSDTDSPKPGRLRRFGRFARKWLVIYVLVSLVLSLIPEFPARVIEVDRKGVRVCGELRAGAGKAVITPEEALWGRMNLYNEAAPIAGVADDLHARALTFGAVGSDNVVTFVSIDLLVVPPKLARKVKEELGGRGFAVSHLTITATHTHAGPGNFWRVPFASLYMGEYRPEYVEFLVARTADAIVASIRSLRPARVGFASVQTRHLVLQRRYVEPQTGLAPPVDEELEVMRVDAKADGAIIAYVLNFGAHPTALNHFSEGKLSGEFPGAVSNRLEAAHPGAVALFLQGAEGSVRSTSPRPYDLYRGIRNRKFAKVAMQGDMLAYFVAEAEKSLVFDDRVDLAAVSLVTWLPGADAHFFPEERPWLAVRVLTIIPNWIMNQVLDWTFVPAHTTFQAVRINHAYFFTFPCDLSNRLGWELKQMVRREHVFILGQANDYAMGYVLSREEYDMGGIASLGGSERGQCWFGKRAGPFCVKVAVLLARTIREPGAADPLFFGVGDRPSLMPDGRELGIPPPNDAAEKE